MVGKKRLLLAAGTLASIGAVVALATGVTFGFFSATSGPESNSFTAGTVSLTSDATGACTVTQISPGDSGTCTLSATYGGSVPAYLGLDLSINGNTPGSGANNAYVAGSDLGAVVAGANALFDGSANGLQLTLTDGTAQYFFNGTQWETKAGLATNLTSDNGSTGTVNDLFMGAATGTAQTITLGWLLPTTANNAYQAAGSSFRLQIHAVQSANNPATGCTVGQQCPTTTMAWN
jgi:predicted ribosomally synthesized peptide with SipW-like signal peptide